MANLGHVPQGSYSGSISNNGDVLTNRITLGNVVGRKVSSFSIYGNWLNSSGSKIRLGLYSDDGNNGPEDLLDYTNILTVTNSTPQWLTGNSQVGYTLIPNTKYWLALLNTTGGTSDFLYYWDNCINTTSQGLTALTETKGLWKFNGDLTDETSLNNDLTCVSPTYVDGFVDSGPSALAFKDTDIASLAAVDATDFDFGQNSFTIEGWFKYSYNSTSVDLQKRNGSTGPGYRLISWNDGTFRLEVKDSNGSATDADSASGAFDIGVWTYVVYVIDRSGGTVTCYVNGEVSGTPSDISSWTGNISVPTEDLKIRGYGNTAIDEICITAKALTATEIINRAKGAWGRRSINMGAATQLNDPWSGTSAHAGDMRLSMYLNYTTNPGGDINPSKTRVRS